jgi:neutral ceramidase
MRVVRIAVLLSSALIPLGTLPAAGVAASLPGPVSGDLRAGAARVDITPEGPVALDGYLNPESRLSEGVHDRLCARAVALSSGSSRLVLVSADVGAFLFAAYFQRIIAERNGLQPEDVLLGAIHTHSGPTLSLNADYPHANNYRYTRLLEDKLVGVVREALASLAPVRVSVGRSTSMVNASRRRPGPGGEIEMAPNPDGPVDHDVSVVRLDRVGGRPLAILFSFPCHSRSLRAPNTLVSGDVIGIAEQAVERAWPGGIVAAGFAGASADIDPVRVVDGFGVREDGVPVTEQLGTKLGGAVVEAAAAARPPTAASGLRSASTRVRLPARRGQEQRAVEVTVAVIGGIAVVALDCEAAVEIGLAIKARSPFPSTFIATICNGWAGYLPVAHQYAEGGYEVARTGFAEGAAEALVDEVVRLLTRAVRANHP